MSGGGRKRTDGRLEPHRGRRASLPYRNVVDLAKALCKTCRQRRASYAAGVVIALPGIIQVRFHLLRCCAETTCLSVTRARPGLVPSLLVVRGFSLGNALVDDPTADHRFGGQRVVLRAEPFKMLR